MEANDIARFTVKDTVFRDLFRDSKYLLELYKALHQGECDATEADIEPITLESVLMADLYNDVGFRVKNEIFILIEAQSTWSMNIIIRMFMYLAETYNNYYRETKQSLYSSKKVSFPKPELYVIYTGEGNKKDVISLSDEFLNGEKCSIDISVKVLSDGKQGDIINQYINFTKVYQEQIKLYGRTRKTVLETIRICKDRNVLKEYLDKRETEVVTIMMTLFDTEYTFKTYVDSEKREAKQEGEKKGRQEGIKEGEKKGRLEGIQEGIKATIKICRDFGASITDTIKKVADEFGLTEDEAEIKVKEYWK
jgi:hypothetical protein